MATNLRFSTATKTPLSAAERAPTCGSAPTAHCPHCSRLSGITAALEATTAAASSTFDGRRNTVSSSYPLGTRLKETLTAQGVLSGLRDVHGVRGRPRRQGQQQILQQQHQQPARRVPVRSATCIKRNTCSSLSSASTLQ